MNKKTIANRKGVIPAIFTVIAALLVVATMGYTLIKVSENQATQAETQKQTLEAVQKVAAGIPLSAAGVPGAGVTLDVQGICRVGSGQRIGDSLSGATINVFDKESATSGATIVPGVGVYKVVDDKLVRVKSMTAYSPSQALDAPATGSVVSFFGGNSSATAPLLVDKLEGFCFDSRSPVVTLDGHSVAQPTGMKVTVYDSATNYQEATKNFNQSQADYYFDLNADQKKAIRVRFENNLSNKLHPFKGFAIGVKNDIADLRYLGVDSANGNSQILSQAQKLTKVECARNISKSDINLDESSSAFTATASYGVGCWAIPGMDYAPLKQYEWVQLNFEIVAGATNPADTNTSASKDIAIIQFLDGGWAEDTNQQPVFDYYTHNQNGDANVGGIENTTSPLGKDSGVIIAGF